MELGAFSVSLSVKDVAVSRDFYARLGFEVAGGDIEQNWLILRNGEHVIGLFQGMFEGNVLTFNPGWDQQGQPVDPYTDVRILAQQIKANGLTLASDVDAQSCGPGSCMLTDPDGNAILIDQHR